MQLKTDKQKCFSTTRNNLHIIKFVCFLKMNAPIWLDAFSTFISTSHTHTVGQKSLVYLHMNLRQHPAALTETSCWQSGGQSGLDVVFRQRHGKRGWGAADEVLVNKDVVVLARNHDRSVVGKRNVVALVVLDGALQRAQQLSAGTEHRQVEVVVIVRHNHLAVWTHADADRIVCYSLASDDSQQSAVIREHLQIHLQLTPMKALEQLLSSSNQYTRSSNSFEFDNNETFILHISL